MVLNPVAEILVGDCRDASGDEFRLLLFLLQGYAKRAPGFIPEGKLRLKLELRPLVFRRHPDRLLDAGEVTIVVVGKSSTDEHPSMIAGG